ncbi:hypothetical protein PLCT2_02484 [Planctomycetaceae bacterium]|nr:hypothetical protein PLCT2_02484 [Planctomycetaceae bacterium]
MVTVERGNHIDEFALSGTAERTGPITMLRKLDAKTAKETEFKLK